ncbi:MAG: DegV family protein [Candidatus Eremiobacteraeota bacterium]|nr:DegV family protein [Candidatus Eremiobacteraeota bacterium]
MSVAIVTDSTSDIDPARAQRLGVDVVPLFVIFGERSFKDYIELTRVQFYEMLERESVLPITSQPTAAMFEEVFKEHVSAGRDIVCVVISQALSGTINAASSAAARFPDAHIEVVDSQTVAGGLGLQVEQAVRLSARGASADEIAETLRQDWEPQRLFAMAPDLSHLERMGRIGKAKAILGTLLRIVPVLRLHGGVVEVEAQVRTFKRAVEVMIEAALSLVKDYASTRLLIMHTNAQALAERVEADLQLQLREPVRSLEILEAGPVIAAHAGRGAVGIFVLEDRVP